MIRIKIGVYGYRRNGLIIPKDKNSPPFTLDPEKERKLVEKGIAEYTGSEIQEERKNPESKEEPLNGPWSEDEQESDQEPDGGTVDQEGQEGPEYDSEMKLADLKEIAEEYGINTKPMKSKAEVIHALDEYFTEEDNEDEEAPPVFGAINPI